MISHPISITFQRVPTHFMDSYDFASDFYLNSKGSYAFSIDSYDFASEFYSMSQAFLCVFYGFL